MSILYTHTYTVTNTGVNYLQSCSCLKIFWICIKILWNWNRIQGFAVSDLDPAENYQFMLEFRHTLNLTFSKY